MTYDGGEKTFEWDAANRLRAINYGGQRSEFTYDGLSRRVKIVEKTGSTVTSTKQLVWVGNTIAQERNAGNVITRSYFAEGEERGSPGARGTQQYYYSRDHLGSIREMTNSTGGVEARYDYDPYGRRTKITGALDVDFGYTGHYFHAPSGLNLTLYRAYNPALGRWLSRDPLQDAELLQGPNLYAYVSNAPITTIDPFGLFGWDDLIKFLGKNLAKGLMLKGAGYGTTLNPTKIGGPLLPPGPWEYRAEVKAKDTCGGCIKWCYYVRAGEAHQPDYFPETTVVSIGCDEVCHALP
jgi:RHS repeat-associated protein